jgi:hypothetical protein
VLAAGMSPRNELALSLAGSAVECHEAGSCREPGQIAGAVEEGFEVGLKI